MTDKERIILNAADEELTPENLPQALQQLAQLKEELQQNEKKIEKLYKLKTIFENKLTHNLTAAAEVLGKRNTKIFDDKIIPYLESENIKIFDIGAGVIFIATAFIYLGLDFGGDEEMKKILPTITAAVKEFYIPVKESTRAAKQKKLNKIISETVQTLFKPQENIEKLKPVPVKKIEFPIDKPNSTIWECLPICNDNEDNESEPVNSLELEIKVEKSGSKKEVSIFVTVDFEELKSTDISKTLTPYDFRVYIAVGSLYNAGNKKITLPQIYYAMGYTTTPTGENLTKIYNSIKKMRSAILTMDNKEEAKEYKNYEYFEHDGYLLPINITAKKIVVNGGITKCVIEILEEPPLITFAKQRGQITTLDTKILESPVNKTVFNLTLENYLLRRISRIKKGNSKQKILYDTVFKHIFNNITNIARSKKIRAKNTIKRYLDHYKKHNYIDNYKEDKDGITIIVKKQKNNQ